jgi:hypothetical protein
MFNIVTTIAKNKKSFYKFFCRRFCNAGARVGQAAVTDASRAAHLENLVREVSDLSFWHLFWRQSMKIKVKLSKNKSEIK